MSVNDTSRNGSMPILLSLTWRQLATPVLPIEILARFVQIKPQCRLG